MRLCVGTDCEPVGRTIGPLQTVQPGLYPRANIYLEKRTPIRTQTICRLHSRGLYPQTNGETPPYVSKQSTDCTTGIVPPSELLFGDTHCIRIQTICRLHSLGLQTQANFYLDKRTPKQSADCTAWDCTPSELLSRETHPHTYSNNANSKAIHCSLR